jgi:hypothetical protein
MLTHRANVIPEADGAAAFKGGGRYVHGQAPAMQSQKGRACGRSQAC